MKKVFYLKTCSTCTRILKELDLPSKIKLQELKTEPVSEEQLEALHGLAGSYEALFNRRSQFYKSKGLKDKKLTEKDYKKFLLEHYTFLKRPVVVVDDQIFIGNAKKTVEAAKKAIHG